jgi:TrmH family RNA methyltransferase
MITSVHNPKVQAVRKLQTQAKARLHEQSFVVEGVRLVDEAVRAGWEATQVLFTNQLDERGRGLVEAYRQRGSAIEQVSEIVMSSVSQTETPQGLLAVIKEKVLPLPDAPDFLLILDGVRDPGNLGTILRSAAAAKVQAVLLPPGNADVTSPKVVRAGMGAHFRLSIHQLGWGGIRSLLSRQERKPKVFLADADAGIAYTRADFVAPLALIIGGEASGAGSEAASLAEEHVHIPMPGGSESLNAAIAASILLFEVLRQRTG